MYSLFLFCFLVTVFVISKRTIILTCKSFFFLRVVCVCVCVVINNDAGFILEINEFICNLLFLAFNTISGILFVCFGTQFVSSAYQVKHLTGF